MSRELTKDEQRRVTDLADFCISRLRPSREKCTALALLRLGEEGERPREMDRLIIDNGWSTDQAIGEMNTFARESFNAVTEDARSYSEIQHYTIVAYDADGKPLSSRQLDITPEVPDGEQRLESATDRGERRQLMRHTEEAFRLAERLSNTSSERILRENQRLCDASLRREGQLIDMTDRFCNVMIKMAEREAERAKHDFEIEKMRRREDRIDEVMLLGMKALEQRYGAPQIAPVVTPQTNQATVNPMAKLVGVLNSMTSDQRLGLMKLLSDEQLKQLEEAMQDYHRNSQQQVNANGAAP